MAGIKEKVKAQTANDRDARPESGNSETDHAQERDHESDHDGDQNGEHHGSSTGSSMKQKKRGTRYKYA